MTWVVEADDLDTLDRRTSALIDYYAGPRLGINLWTPPGDQDLLYKQLVIGDTRRVAEFDNFRPMTTLAAAWFHGGTVVGAATGLFLAQNIGTTPGPYLDRLSDAQMERGAVTTLFLGTTGAGKTTAAALALLGESVMGAWTCMTDFKGDMGGICTAAARCSACRSRRSPPRTCRPASSTRSGTSPTRKRRSPSRSTRCPSCSPRWRTWTRWRTSAGPRTGS